MTDPVIIDQFISAEIPDQSTPDGQRLYDIIANCMTHGPCGDLDPSCGCMTENKQGKKVCSKNFPKQFQDETTVNEDGYPDYRRRNNGKYITKRVNGQDVKLDNRWIVPYSPFLSLKYDCHINVEVCNTVRAVKYIHKYIYKGNDRVTMEVTTACKNEIEMFLKGRYISPVQAAWNIMEFEFHGEDPTVYQLPVHLPNQQLVYRDDSLPIQDLRSKLQNATSELMGFFQYNKDNEDGRRYLYHEFPEHYVWHKEVPYNKHWAIRKSQRAIGRIVHLPHNAGEKFYLRLLLTKIPGPTSFEDLRTVDGVVHSTFKETCLAKGFIENNNEWVLCFAEAINHTSGEGLRTMFVSALLSTEIANPLETWTRYREAMCDDLPRRLQRDFVTVPNIPNVYFDYGLFLMAKALRIKEQSLQDFGLPNFTHHWENITNANSLIQERLDYDVAALQKSLDENLPRLNAGQKHAYETITSNIDNNIIKSYFLRGFGGSGKTFVYKRIAERYRAKGEIVLWVASSGIASLLLPGGSTAHSRLKIPLKCTSTCFCNINRDDETAELLRQTKLIIWDEATVQNKSNLEALNRSLKDLRDRPNELFGGLLILFGGDWAQTLPVVKHGSREQIVGVTLQSASFWSEIEVLHLQETMRMQKGHENALWADYINDLSYKPQMRGKITLPTNIDKFHDQDTFLNSIYPDDQLNNGENALEFFSERAILAPHNVTCTDLNNKVLGKIRVDAQTYHSIDEIEIATTNDDFLDQMNPEYLASLNTPSLPLSKLVLKVGSPVMLLRNINPQEDLCNGTRLIITHLGTFYIQGRIMTGDRKGQEAYLFRVKLNSSDEDFPWKLTRKQFPIRLAFAMTINKSQGQSMNFVGVDLRQSCFSHGQPYVAFSRVTQVCNLKILLEEDQAEETDNVVYPEVLIHDPNENLE